MAKDKKIQEIKVKNPKIGEKYFFKFAGSTMYGPIIDTCNSLAKIHGHSYFWFINEREGRKSSKYPISIYNISKNEKDV